MFGAKNNRLDGALPADMSNLSSLVDLVLSGNRINGTIPTSIKLLRWLVWLDLGSNRISGTVPSESLAMLPYLETIELSEF